MTRGEWDRKSRALGHVGHHGRVTTGASAEDVADAVEAAIRSGAIPPGGKVPSQVALAAEYGVAEGTAGRVHAILRSRGLILPGDRRGTRVVDDLPAPGTRRGSTEERLAALEAWRAEVERRLP